MGAPPFLEPGDVVMWRYRDHGWVGGSAETASPMRVVRDDERGLVAWLAPGTIHLTKRYADGRDLRDEPLERRFRLDAERIQARTRWHGGGILRMAPAERPWSVWLFWDAPDVGSTDGWVFEGWYVNLENAHLRSGTDTYTGDHVLDLWIEADGTINLKDDDELDAAAEQRRVDPSVAAQVRHNAELARAAYASGEWCFDEAWTGWRPDPDWPNPSLPAGERWVLDLAQEGADGSAGPIR
jgi:hypothetical protein